MTDAKEQGAASESAQQAEGEAPAAVAVPIWLRPWFQFLLGATVVFVFLSFVLPPIAELVYAVRAVLTPVVFALVLAYIFNPLVTFMDQRMKIPRWGGTSIIMGAGLLMFLIGLVIAVPMLLEQSAQLIERLEKVYPKVVASVLDEEATVGDTADALGTGANGDTVSDADEATEQMSDAAAAAVDGANQAIDEAANGGDVEAAEAEPEGSAFSRLIRSDRVQSLIKQAMVYVAEMDWGTVAKTVFSTMDVGSNVVGSAISLTTYWIVFAMVAAFTFFFLSWKLGEFGNWFIPFIPVDHRDRTLSVLARMDRTVSAWLRGRLFQAFLLSIMLTVGWGIAGVPYWFLLGVLCGVLGLVPYLIFIGWAIALLLTALDSMASPGGFSWWVLLWPTVVYLIAQTIDGWVVEPLVQGKATEMGTLTVLLVVMIGGSLGGLIGLLIAIPVAACIKILCVELLLPYLRDIAAGRRSMA